MGTVGRQSIISSIFIYLGFAIGALNILILFPRYFSPEQIGLSRILLDVSMVLSTLCTLGSVPITLRFFPFYRARLTEHRNDLAFISLSLGIIGCLGLLVLLPQFKPLIVRKFGARSPLFVEYFQLIYPMAISLVFFSILEAHAWNWRRSVLSNALKELGFRILTTALIILFIAGWIGFDDFITIYAWIYLPPVMILSVAIAKAGGLRFSISQSKVTRRLKGQMASFGTFMLGGAILNVVARTNDTIIIASQSTGGLADAAVFTIATYLVTVMDVPQRSLVAISTPFIAEAWKVRDLGRIERLYKKTSLNLLLAGLAIFCLVLLNIQDAIKYLGTGYEALGLLVIVSGIGKIIDLSTGLNTQILLLSRYWKVEFVTNLMLVALSIPLNYWLTQKYNVYGPAYGNLISLFLFNLSRLILIWQFFRIQPFSKSHLSILVLGAASYFISSLLPDTGYTILNLAVRSTLFVSLFGSGVYVFRVSEDLNDLFANAARLARQKLWR